MRRHFFIAGTLGLLVILSAAQSCRKPDPENPDLKNEWLSGGSQTVFDEGSGAYSHAFPNLSADKLELHGIGDAAFEATFVTAPAPVHGGLGPLYNSVSCAGCHIADGRGKPPGVNEQMQSMLFRLSIPGTDAHGGPLAAPGFGGQLQQRVIFGYQPEGDISFQYTEEVSAFADGTPYSLRRPSYTLINAYTNVPAGLMMSPRVAPPVFGLGLLEAVPDADILKNEDIGDADGNGISGKANYVWDIQQQQMALGRFGWKAGHPTLLQQSAGAYNQDMGITSFLFPEESGTGQPQMDHLQDETEISDSLLYAVAFYMRSLAVPARRDVNDESVKRGQELFTRLNCSSCHTPSMRTGVNYAFPEISNQKIYPYSDLLLHDMGPDLADNRPDYSASGTEWRTPPLWGIGLTDIVNGHSFFLHDGRARSLMEAILWHGGEAENSKQAVKQLSQQQRDDLIRFLESL